MVALPSVRLGLSMSGHIDLCYDSDMDNVAGIALDVAEKIRRDEYGRRELFNEIVGLCRWHPVKAAQLLMVFAAWFDDAPDEILDDRVRSITHPEIDWYAVEVVVRERLWRVGHRLNQLERREVIARLGGVISDGELGSLLGMTGDAVSKVRSRMTANGVAS
ncbi:hypothetical protein [Mycobacterium kansasii]|uniref:hypothetical protein n=1 Tax=Mycobacterium kansasii TaxID=1768 RepID=UPI0015E40D75|nr:hypothetical protein [Mycobacterium kansasii]